MDTSDLKSIKCYRQTAISGIQRQFLVSSELYPDSAAYNIGSITKISGGLDCDRLITAWQCIVGKVEMLRSGFDSASGLRTVHEDSAGASLAVLECGDSEVRALALAGIELPFALNRAPPVRARLYRVHERLHYLVIVQHHIATDLFSKELLFDQLSRCYGNPSYEPNIEPYEIVVDAESSYSRAPQGEKSRTYWLEKLGNPPETLHMPSSRARAQQFSGCGKQLVWSMPQGLEGRMADVRSDGRHPFLWLLAAYACTLSKLTGQREFFMGVPFTNRRSISGRPILGPCVNILPVLAKIEPNDTFHSLYERLRGEMLICHRHQDIPFVDLVRFYKADHDPVRPHLLQAGFTSEPPTGVRLPGLECDFLPFERSGSQMDVYFSWWEESGKYRGTWEYNSDSFGGDDCHLWMDTFNRILEQSLTNGDCAIEKIPYADTEKVRGYAEGPVVPGYLRVETVAGFLRKAYVANATGEALLFRGVSHTYGDFAEKVKRIAVSVRKLSGSGGRVVVCLERSPELVIGLHGVIQSGNAYVPIGVDWPDDRILDILTDIEPALVLTQRVFTNRFSGAPCPVTDIESLLDGQRAEPGPDWPPLETGPEDTFYILYTSGTTGKPKGVQVPNKGILNHLYWMQETYNMQKRERCLLKTTYTFDVSVWELYWPFHAGACLVISDEQQPKDPREILELCRKARVNRANFVPSLLELFLDQKGLEELVELRHVNCIGEALTVDLSGRFRAIFPDTALHNLYGPTEASVSVSFRECDASDAQRGTVPIGQPMANTQLYVVDEYGQLCPPLVKGELLIGGTCLALGYWKRPELTAERFIPNPFGPGRLYRTGDWCRYALDGSIEYLERKDTQTKFRGIRLELGEIESHLMRIDGIEQVVVKKGRDATGQECLITYYRARGALHIPAGRFRDCLRAYLPESLIPAYYRSVKSFPMNDNGKIDRKALADIVTIEADITRGPALSEKGSETETKVARLWGESIGSIPTDLSVNFFDGGGNSMSLLVLRGYLERDFGVSLKVSELFGNPTVSGMARLIDSRSGGGTTSDGAQDAAARRAKKRQASLGLLGRATRGTD